MVYEIRVVPYDPNWPLQFATEAASISSAMGDNCIAVHHVGSTSVPGLAAKSRIDILLVVRQRKTTIDSLATIGYEYRGEFNIPLHYGFRKRGAVEFNLHAYEADHTDIEALLMLRDYLRSNPLVRDKYGALKQQLLELDASFEKNNSIYTGYTLGKNDFICNILEKAGFNRLRFMRCTHHAEWDAAKNFRQKYFFDKVPVVDPYTWTFNHPEHVHFILYKGTNIIGYAHIQLWPKNKAAIRIIVIEDISRGHGFGAEFLHLIEKWLKEQGYNSIHTESTPEARSFYQKQGYVAMPFNDPEGRASDPRDISMGKML